MGIGMTVHRTLTHPAFLKDPHKSASEVWEMSGLVNNNHDNNNNGKQMVKYNIILIIKLICRRYLAPNGAIMRTSILGILNFNGKLTIISSLHIMF